MKIILDAMGGDNAPQAVVQGALEAHAQCGADIVLVGREEAIRACLTVAGQTGGRKLQRLGGDLRDLQTGDRPVQLGIAGHQSGSLGLRQIAAEGAALHRGGLLAVARRQHDELQGRAVSNGILLLKRSVAVAGDNIG